MITSHWASLLQPEGMILGKMVLSADAIPQVGWWLKPIDRTFLAAGIISPLFLK